MNLREDAQISQHPWVFHSKTRPIGARESEQSLAEWWGLVSDQKLLLNGHGHYFKHVDLLKLAPHWIAADDIKSSIKKIKPKI